MESMALRSLRKIKGEIISPPKTGEIVEGKILNWGKSSVFLDLGPKGIGIIYGREFQRAKDALKGLAIGDKVSAKVLDLESEEGYRELSLVEAAKEVAWVNLEEKKEKEEIIEVEVKGANKGGLICQVHGISGFLPASQLSPQHYPKVENGEGAKIASALQKFVGKKLKVKIIALDPKKEKLILSEKSRKLSPKKEDLAKYRVGDIVEGKITGVTNFGAFLGFDKNLEGLIHASEISETKDPTEILKIGQKVKAKIIEIINNRIYLSLKDLPAKASQKTKSER
ncbi:S1 RNA-binding domain-containing protein [bacterium]|nr:S1 RNA-binding domain-containing protein [bacterium]